MHVLRFIIIMFMFITWGSRRANMQGHTEANLHPLRVQACIDLIWIYLLRSYPGDGGRCLEGWRQLRASNTSLVFIFDRSTSTRIPTPFYPSPIYIFKILILVDIDIHFRPSYKHNGTPSSWVYAVWDNEYFDYKKHRIQIRNYSCSWMKITEELYWA